VKKGRHRRFEEARAMKRSQGVDFDALLDSLSTDEADHKPEHEAWSDLDDEPDDGFADEDDD
jgi:hypothetical protein